MNTHTPHKGEVSLLILIVIVLAFLAIGFYAGTFFGGGAATTTPLAVGTPGAADDAYGDTATWLIDTRTDAGFRIAHPSDLEVRDTTVASDDWRLDNGTAAMNAFTLTVPKSFEPGTNFSEAHLNVIYTGSPALVAECFTPPDTGNPAHASTTTTVNGQSFQVFDSNDAGAGNLYDTVSYRATHDGRCYRIEYTIHSTQLGNYPAGTVTAFDEAKVEALMQRVVNTFSFI